MESLKSPSNDCVTKQELLGAIRLSDLELESIRRMIDAESEIVNESMEDVEENQAERGIVRTSEGTTRLVMIRMKQ